MSLAAKLLMTAGSSAVDKIYSDDVFQSFTRTGSGASQTTTTNIDMTQGYTLWSKSRSAATDHSLYASSLGVTIDLVTNASAGTTTQAQGLTSVSATGHTYGTLAKVNTSAATYIDWVFRDAANFHKQATVTKSSGSNATYNFSTITTLGMVRVKRTDAAGSWYIWHRSATAGKLLIGETTAAEATLGHITVSGNTVTLVNGVIADGTYLVEAFAHDTSADGIIQCGVVTSAYEAVTLGWEPQYILVKRIDTTGSWRILDTARGLDSGSSNQGYLLAESSAAEAVANLWNINATGFKNTGNSGSLIYLAIRRPNKPPTAGTQVYNAIARTGTGVDATVTGVGFAPDLVSWKRRNNAVDGEFMDRLRGVVHSIPNKTDAEGAMDFINDLISYDMDGVSLGPSNSTWINSSGGTEILHFFKRAPGVFDQICFSGTGANKTESHGLASAPELWLVKGRSGATQWVWGSSLLANTEKIVMPSPAGKVTDATAWNSTYPTSSVISLGTAAAVNTSAATYTAYLWATKTGISKVFGYTGDGASGKVINCGFTTGARFVMIVRADTTGSVFIWDTVRGIVAGNDPHLCLDTNAKEVTTDDSIDPNVVGFYINQVAATNINVNGATYIGLAFA